jgi:hypothetical protein
MQARQAPNSQIAVARMNDYGPLLRRGEASKARDILLGCRQVLLDANELGMLGVITGGVADVEAGLGHFDNAIKLAWDALRYGYAAGDAGAIRDVYHNLGNYLVKHASQLPPSPATCVQPSSRPSAAPETSSPRYEPPRLTYTSPAGRSNLQQASRT